MLSDTFFPDVFVSYAREDAAWVRKLVSELRRAGFTVFLDEDSLRYGDDIHLLIDRALTTALRIVFVMSEASLKSKWTQFESTHDWSGIYLESSARLLPVRLSGENVPARLSKLRCLDFQHRSFEQSFSALEKALTTLETLTLGPVEISADQELDITCQQMAHRLKLYFGHDAGTLSDFELCCSEIGQNALSHTPDRIAEMTLTATPLKIELEVLDRGQGFDLAEVLDRAASVPDPKSAAERLTGLGLVAAHADQLISKIDDRGHLVRVLLGRKQLKIVRAPLSAVVSSTSAFRLTAFTPPGRRWAYLLVRGRLGIAHRPQLPWILHKLEMAVPRLAALAIDLRDCSHIDSSALTDLVDTLVQARKKSIALPLVVQAGSRIERLLEISRLLTVFEILHSPQEGEAWLNRHTSVAE